MPAVAAEPSLQKSLRAFFPFCHFSLKEGCSVNIHVTTFSQVLTTTF